MWIKNKIKEYIFYIKNIILKIKDYDRLEYDYGYVLCHATCGLLSKTGYKLDFVCNVIDEQQEEKYKEYEHEYLKNQKQKALEAFRNTVLYADIHHIRPSELCNLNAKFKEFLEED